jgi:hypothetical protein
MIIGRPIKQPADVQDYDIDFSQWLPIGDSLVSATVSTPTGITLDVFYVTSPIVKIWVSGGVAGNSYKFQIIGTTDFGRVKETELVVKVKEY